MASIASARRARLDDNLGVWMRGQEGAAYAWRAECRSSTIRNARLALQHHASPPRLAAAASAA